MRSLSLGKIYGKIPELKCIEGCTECCGSTSSLEEEGEYVYPFNRTLWSKIEARNIRKWLKKKGVKERLVKNPLDPCPYIENGKCLIYPVRPLMCRLFGVVDDLKCPYVKPKFYLTSEEATKLIQMVYEEGFDVDP